MATTEDGVRVFELTEVNSFDNDDYLLIDKLSNTEAKKIKAKRLGITYTITVDDDGGGFTFSGDNGYSVHVSIPKDAEMDYDTYEALTEAEKMDDSNRFIIDYPSEEREPEIWARVGRDPLNTDQKTISKAINELDSRTKAVNGDAFDDTVTYSKGDYSIYDNKMYVYTSDTPSSGSWDSTKWTQTDIQTEFAEIKSNLTEKTKDIATATISSTATTKYTTAGDGWRICMRNGIVSLDMVIDVKSAQSGWTDVGQIPSNFPYPPQVIYFPCNTWGAISSTKLDLQITTGGVIKMRAGVVTQYYVHLSW